jgi:hypothetical protein
VQHEQAAGVTMEPHRRSECRLEILYDDAHRLLHRVWIDPANSLR